MTMRLAYDCRRLEGAANRDMLLPADAQGFAGDLSILKRSRK